LGLDRRRLTVHGGRFRWKRKISKVAGGGCRVREDQWTVAVVMEASGMAGG
jgi:hypothetical protein